jgi:hypothetical protein
MTSLLHKFVRYYEGLVYPLQIGLLLLLCFGIWVACTPLSWLESLVTGLKDRGPEITLTARGFIEVAILVPLIETLIAQLLIYKLVMRINPIKNKMGYFFFLSSALFGISHFYSLSYILTTAMIGLILAFPFYYYHNNIKMAFWTTAIVHALNNGISFAMYYYNIGI